MVLSNADATEGSTSVSLHDSVGTSKSCHPTSRERGHVPLLVHGSQCGGLISPANACTTCTSAWGELGVPAIQNVGPRGGECGGRR